LIKNRRDIDIKGKERDAFLLYKQEISDTSARLKQKIAKDRELS
jgi:hypothetical protein